MSKTVNIPKGYKQSQLGLIPEEWESIRLDEICEMRNGYTPSKANVEYWTNGDIPWFRMEDIRTNGHILRDSIQHITRSAVKGSLFSANSIIISTTATIGEHALLIVDSLANQQFTNLKIRESLKDKVLIDFFYWYCFLIGDWCRKNINEGGLQSVNMREFERLTVLVPPLAEQRKIADVLSTWDKAIELQEIINNRERIITFIERECERSRKLYPNYLSLY